LQTGARGVYTPFLEDLAESVLLSRSKFLLYPFLVEPDDPAVADLITGTPVCPVLRTLSRAASGFPPSLSP